MVKESNKENKEPNIVELVLNDLGEGLNEGTVVNIHFKEGDIVKEGEDILVIENDKLSAGIPSPVSGKIKEICCEEGEIVPIKSVLAKIVELDVEKVDYNLADEMNIEQVEEYAENIDTNENDPGEIIDVEKNEPILEEEIVVEKISRLRKAISKKMVIAKTIIPETTLMDEVIIDKLIALRKQKKIEAESQGVKLTYMAFISKAVIIALKEFPLFNASFNDETDELIKKKTINLGIAVDTSEGLIVPNIKNAQCLNVMQLATEIQTIAKKTREKKITMNEMTNGTFTISNYGSIGAVYGTPIINHPEVAILGIGKMIKKPIVLENNQIGIGTVLPLSLTIDHRIIDGSDAIRFLNRIIELLNDTTVLANNMC